MKLTQHNEHLIGTIVSVCVWLQNPNHRSKGAMGACGCVLSIVATDAPGSGCTFIFA